MRNSSTVTGSTSCPSVATTVIFKPGMRISKKVIDDPLMTLNRTFSPRRNKQVQFPAGVTPFVKYVYACPDTSSKSDAFIRICPHIQRSDTVAGKPFLRVSLSLSVLFRWLFLLFL